MAHALWPLMPPKESKLAALAGWLAVHTELHGMACVKKWISNPEPVARVLRMDIIAGGLSATDLNLMDGWDQKDLVVVLKVLRRDWNYLLEWAEEVMASPRNGRDDWRNTSNRLS